MYEKELSYKSHKLVMYPQRQITADKRKIKDFPKSPSATSFIRKPLGDIAGEII